jgi:hypothetical protein
MSTPSTQETEGSVASNRRAATTVGLLYIIGTVTGILSLIAYGPVLTDPDYLTKVAAKADQIRIGAIFVLCMGFSLAMVPVILFPILRKHNETLALGYVVFRGGLETVTYIALAISWLCLILVSQDYVAAGVPGPSYFQALGGLLLKGHDSINTVLIVVFSLGALMLYSVLYQSRLVPRWISGWGLIAILLHLCTGFLTLFGVVGTFATITVVMDLPIALQEMVMAVWLIVKGFNAPAVVLGLPERVPV